MKITGILILISGVFSQDIPSLPLEIDVRSRSVQDSLIYVIVQVNNHTTREIEELEGFISIKDGDLILKEHRLTLVHSYESPLHSDHQVSRAKTFSSSPGTPYNYEFQISKVRFSGDKKVYSYHPAVGFIRID